MTQEDKELLLKDLCARLPHGVVVHIYDINVDNYDRQLIPEDIDFFQLNIRNYKPYLRPLSSMTKEELDNHISFLNKIKEGLLGIIPYYLDWLNKNHFDYRGLIPKGLALVAPKDIYNNKK